MDKFITLCWECRKLMRDAFDVYEYDSRFVKDKCENCGKQILLKYCRVLNKPKGEM